RATLRRRHRLLGHHLHERVHGAAPLEGRHAGEQFVEHGPRAQTSVCGPIWRDRPPACSGAMYDGVPITAPVAVDWPDTWSRLASPKSAILGIKDEGGRMRDESEGFDSSLVLPPSSFLSRMLAGLRSRWTTPRSWAWWMARASTANRAAAWGASGGRCG